MTNTRYVVIQAWSPQNRRCDLYLSFTKDHTKLDVLQIRALVSKLLNSCLTAIKSHVIRYCETVYETSNKNWFCTIKYSGEVLSKLKCRWFRATSLSRYDFSTLYTISPHNLIKEKLLDLIEWTFKRALKTMVHSIWHVMGERLFSRPLTKVGIHFGHVRMCATPYPISWIIFMLDLGPSYTDKIFGIPMGTNCAPLVADLFSYCYKRDFMDSLDHDNQTDVIEAFNSTSRYLDDLLNIDDPYFEGMVNQIYPPELQLNKANISGTEAPFLFIFFIYLFTYLFIYFFFLFSLMSLSRLFQLI